MSDETDQKKEVFSSGRLIVAGFMVSVLVLGFALISVIIGWGGKETSGNGEAQPVNVLENSDNECVVCHQRSSPGIVEQYGRSSMAAAGVTCQQCHEVDSDYPGATRHQGTYVLATPTTQKCAQCHQQEVAEFNQSRHGLPAYVAMWGTKGLSEKHKKMYEQIPEANKPPNETRNALFAMEGREITKFACEKCHNIGKPQPDGSVGQCQKCHLRHKFNLEQARKPETCNACHIGPDHPQFEIYENSPHGISYHTEGDHWNWEAEAGTLTTEDFPAPTCATCHMSGFGGSSTTHDVGERLTWYLFAPVSERRPAWQDNRTRMQNVCSSCHNQNFVDTFYKEADQATQKVNSWVRESQEILKPLRENNLLTEQPFDEPIEFEAFELWHHWGRTAKFGVWMQGPDYTQWHGAYEVLRSMSHLREQAREIKEGSHGNRNKNNEKKEENKSND